GPTAHDGRETVQEGGLRNGPDLETAPSGGADVPAAQRPSITAGRVCRSQVRGWHQTSCCQSPRGRRLIPFTHLLTRPPQAQCDIHSFRCTNLDRDGTAEYTLRPAGWPIGRWCVGDKRVDLTLSVAVEIVAQLMHLLNSAPLAQDFCRSRSFSHFVPYI